jgi:predicted nucleic acid-binding protein
LERLTGTTRRFGDRLRRRYWKKFRHTEKRGGDQRFAEDADDNLVLGTACGGKANYVVTGEKHLLKLKQFRGIRVVSVKEMLDLLGNIKTA